MSTVIFVGARTNMHKAPWEQVGIRNRSHARGVGVTRRGGWLALLIAGALTTIVLSQTPAAASSTTPPFILADNCVEHQAFLDGEPAAVRTHLPSGYAALQDPQTGRPLLFARAEQCDVTIAGSAARATLASFGVVIHSPDGMGCASAAGQAPGDAIPYCNWYPLFWVANDRRVADWLTAGTPDFPAYFVPGLVLSQGTPDPIAGTRFHFQAPAPAPSPFSMEDAGHAGPSRISVRGGYWRRTREGTVKLTFATDDITPGSAAGGIVHAQPGSEMAQLMGSDQEPYVAFYATQIGAEHWDHGSYRKQILGPAPHTDSFSGACSLQGTDYFSPPASNSAQQLELAYRAQGTCTGTLDGRSIAGAPVGMIATARPYGSCSQARTLAPGSAAIAFASGPGIELTYDFTSQGTEVDGIYYGTRWGYARAHATFATQRTGPSVITDCARGTASQVPMDLTLTTATTLASASTGGAPGAGHGHARTLRLRVRPRHAVVGRRITFFFRVTNGTGAPIGGATIRLGSRTARSNAHGTATITLTLRLPGALTARATKRGWPPVAVAVAVGPAGAGRRVKSPVFTG